MKVVILAGGYGTRIKDVSEDIPKPMIPIGSYPIIWHIMKYYSSFGHNEFIICLGYKGYVIKDYFLNYESYTRDFTIELGKNNNVTFHNTHTEYNWKITMANTGLDSMTGSRISKISHFIDKDEDFMLTYGDGVGNVNIDNLLKFHKNHGKILTVTGVRPPGRFGELVYDSNNKVKSFNEKPQTSEGRISGGFFVANSKIFDYLNEDNNLVFEKEPIENLVKSDNLMVFEHNDFWQPMDTSREFHYLNNLYNSKNAPWVIW